METSRYFQASEKTYDDW